ncbi:histidine phosphatase family protein [Asaia prunellae]|uniref:histidine phosphatase family protein n=1 Tax=Asaia prunellae TaxID=610245 RepID=UPI000470CD3A|nr:histidine phosphatase family protein [Asaia prunellae]
MKPGFSVLLTRHPPVLVMANCCYGRTDVPLAPGWETCVENWQGHGQGPVFASPAQRCQLAAAKLAAGAPVLTDTRLSEMDFGFWEGQSWSAIPREALDDWAADPHHYQPGGGENVETLVIRVSEFWHHILGAARSCQIVTHGGPLRVMQALAENRPFRMEDPAPAQGEAVLLHFFNKNGVFVAQKQLIR